MAGRGFIRPPPRLKGVKMKTVMFFLALMVASFAVYAAQDVTLDGMREVRDPVQLKAWLEANASDAQTRLAAVEAGVVTNVTYTLKTNAVVTAVSVVYTTNSYSVLDSTTNALTIYTTNAVVTVTTGSITNMFSLP
jgi:hypothetical protein